MDYHNLAYLRLSKHLSDFQQVDVKNKLFRSEILASQFAQSKPDNGIICADKEFTLWDIETQRLLIWCCRPNQCYPAFCYKEDLFNLRTFSLRETSEKFDYLVHSTNVPPEIILKEGIKLRYSFSLSKGFPPLIFLSSPRRNWLGKYQYKVKIRQKLYFDTNLNHKCKTGNDWFCVLQNIRPSDITFLQSQTCVAELST